MSLLPTVRSSEDIEKMLAWNIIHQIYNGAVPPDDWMQIGPFPPEMRHELNPIFQNKSPDIHAINIMDDFNQLLVRFVDSNMKETKWQHQLQMMNYYQ